MVALGYDDFTAVRRESEVKEADHGVARRWRGAPAAGSAAVVMV